MNKYSVIFYMVIYLVIEFINSCLINIYPSTLAHIFTPTIKPKNNEHITYCVFYVQKITAKVKTLVSGDINNRSLFYFNNIHDIYR